MVQPTTPPSPATPAPEEAQPAQKIAVNITAPSHQKLVLQPTGQTLNASVDLDALMAKEEAQDTKDQPVEAPSTNTVISPAGAASDGAGAANSDQTEAASPDATQDIAL